MRVGIFSPYLETRGGGERYLLTVAEFFSSRGDQVDLFWDKADKRILAATFHLDLSGVNFVPDVFFSGKNLLTKLLISAKYDLIFFLSDGSIPTTLARYNILHFQRPFRLADGRSWLNKLKLLQFNAIVANSQFTKKEVDKTFGVKSLVLYPPVDTASFRPQEKENLILSVGRFFAPSNPKKQEILIDAFVKIAKKDLPGYRFILAGGVTGDSRPVVEKFKDKTSGLPIEIVTDASFSKLQKLYGAAKIFWHAAGFGQDLKNHPDKAEHFGISTVEAMSAGAVPIVFAAGGQKEIVTEAVDGYFWTTTQQLIKKTVALAHDDKLRQEVSGAAINRAKFFSKENFYLRLHEII